MRQIGSAGPAAWALAAAALAGVPAVGGEPVAATIEQVAWIAGAWGGEAFGSRAEEYWTPPAGGVMLGGFRLHSEGRTSLIEFLSIREHDGRLELRFRHYSAELEAREASPLYFELVALDAHRAVFESPVQERPKRMIYTLTETGELVVRVENERDGEVEGFDVRMAPIGGQPPGRGDGRD